MGRITPQRITLRDGSPALLRTALPADAEPVVAHLERVFRSAPWVLRTPAEATFPLEEQRRRLNDWLFSEGSIALLVERSSSDASASAQLASTTRAASPVIGMLVFLQGDRQKIAHTGEIGMGVDPDCRGLGVGRALLVALLDWASSVPVLSKITLRVMPENTAAMALYASIGFVEEGRLLRHMRHDDGTFHDLASMALYVKPNVAPPGHRTWAASHR